jgi:hypothetical protein
METKQALAILKQILDAASKSGLFENLTAAMTAADAYNAVAREILKEEDGDGSVI